MRTFTPFIVFPLAGCATDGGQTRDDGASLDTYRRSAGEPVTSFRVDGGVNRWTALGERHIAVWAGAREAYLLELGTPCPDLENAVRIALIHDDQRVDAGFDGIVVHGAVTTVTPARCTIATIRPLDVDSLNGTPAELGEMVSR